MPQNRGLLLQKIAVAGGRGERKLYFHYRYPTLILELLLLFFFYRMHVFPSLNKLNFSKIKK